MSDESDQEQSILRRKKLKNPSRLALDSESENEEAVESVASGSSENEDESSEGEEDEDDEDGESGSEGNDEASDGESSECEDSASNSEWDTQSSDSDSSDEEEDGKQADTKEDKAKSAVATAISNGYSSDSSDGTSDKCPICLLRFTDQEVGTPESCDHSFCADCLQEWSKTVNTCPVDRQEFSLILVRRRVEGKVIRKVPVEVKAKDEEPPDDPTYCEVCGNCDREDRMLLCDGCDLGYHMECLSPALDHVPIEEWFCPECAPQQLRPSRLDSANHNDVDLEDEPLAFRVHRSHRLRVLPRTLQLERIRVQVVSAVEQRRSDDGNQPSTSIGADSEDEPGTSAERRWNKVTRKRKKRYVARKTSKKKKSTTKKKRKTTTRKTCKSTKTSKTSTGKKRKVVRRKSGTKKKKKRRRKTTSSRPRRTTRTARVVVPQSVRGRLAEQLGMRPLRQPWQTVPEVRSSSAPVNNINFQRFRAGIPTLHLFGHRDQLDYFSGSDDEHRDMEGGGETAVASQARPSVSVEHRLSNRKRLLAALHRPSPAPKPKIITIDPSADANCDIVGSILSSQSKWLSTKKADVVINRDGSLDFKTKEPAKEPERSADPLERLQEGKVDVNNASSSTEKHIARTPLYPGGGGGGGGPRRSHPGGGNVNNFNYRGRPAGGSPGGFAGASSSNFRSSYSGPSGGFGPQNTRAQYEHFLGNNAQNNNPAPRSAPLRFRLNTPRLLRRGPNMLNRRPAVEQNQDERNNGRRAEDAVRSDGAKNDDEEDVDIYSDIEPDTAGKDGSEHEEGGEKEYGALMPPPEPPAMLMAGFGDVGSDDDASDSELVIDDRWAASPKGGKVDGKGAEAGKEEEDKYDPADPSHDSDNEESMTILADDIPLPPDKPPEAKPPPTPTGTRDATPPCEEEQDKEPEATEKPKKLDEEDDKSIESEEIEESKEKGVEKELAEGEEAVEKDTNATADANSDDESDGPGSPVKEDIPLSKDESSAFPKKEENGKADKVAEESSESDDDDCPNFSIYSAASMELARRSGDDDENKKEVEVAKESEDHSPALGDGEKNEEDKKTDVEEAKKTEEEEEEDKDEAEVKKSDVEKEIEKEEESEEAEKGDEAVAISCDDDAEDKEGSDSPAPDSRTKVDGEGESEAESDARKEALLEVNVEKDEERELNESVKDDEESPSEDDAEVKRKSKRRRASSNSDEDGPADSTEKIPLKKRHDDDDEEDKGKDAQTLLDEIYDSDDDSLVGGATSAVSTGTLENLPVASVVPGLEGLETETISETEEAINFDDDLSDGDDFEDSGRRRKKKRSRRSSGEDAAKKDSPCTRPLDGAEFEEGEILDEALRDQHKKDRKDKEKETIADENVDTSKSKVSPTPDDDKKKKRRRGGDKKASSKDRAVVSSTENKSKGKEKSSRSDDISWKKPSKSTRDRNYRDGKEKGKDDREERENSRSRKKKEKRKDLERYDVRKVLSDKTLSKQNKDAFGRDIDRRRSLTRSRSRSRARSVRRSRSRSRSPRVRAARSSSRSRTRARPRNRSLSRGRSRSRSRHRSPLRSKDRPKRSRSKDKKKKPSRERDRSKRSRSKNRSGSRARNRSRGSVHRSRSRSPVRAKERRKEVREQPRVRASWSRSQSPSRSWSPSLTGSPQYPVNQNVGRRHERAMLRSLSRSWSREPVERPGNNLTAAGKRRKNLTVIVTNSKEERKRRRELARRNSRRRPSPVPSKEVFASGDNILVSVNFKSNKSSSGANAQSGLAGSRKKRDETRAAAKRARREKASKTSKGDAQAAAPEKATGDKRKKAPPPEANQKPVAIIDLEQSPFREYTPSPKDVIVLSDSEEDLNQKTVEELEQMLHHRVDEEGLNISGMNSSLDEGQLQSSGHSGVSNFLMTSTGPKTPPEPQIKFSISTKQQLRTISNPLLDHDEDEEAIEDDMTHKGPNTPPESPLGPATPASPATSPDAYDPFDPTKSRSPSPDQGAVGANSSGVISGSPRTDGDHGENGPVTVDEALPKSTAASADASDDTKTSPKKATEADTASKTSPSVLPEVSRMLDSLDDADKKKTSPDVASSADATSTSVAGKAAVSSAGSTEVTSTSSSRANLFNTVASTTTPSSQRLLASVMKGTLVTRPATKAAPPLPKTAPLRQNGEPPQQPDVIDMDLDSPYSPASSEGDDLFEPPPNYSSSRGKSSAPARAQKTAASTKDKFDNLFGSSPMMGNKLASPWTKNLPLPPTKGSAKNAAKLSKLVKHMAKLRKADPGGAGGKMDEDQLKILDEVPSSAVEMQVKDKFLKKLNRQERVVEEVKLALKPHYYKKVINKEDYKEILRRSVPKICHNRSGDINPIKIRGLVEAYVKKVRYLKKKASGQLPKAKTSSAAIAAMVS